MEADHVKHCRSQQTQQQKHSDDRSWAYAQRAYDAASDTFSPSQLDQRGAECGFASHTKVSAQDYTFTAYPK
jgi:hypothetical protein